MSKGKDSKGAQPRKVTSAGAVEINEDQLDQASGGADFYLKIDGVDGEVTARMDTTSLNFTKTEK